MSDREKRYLRQGLTTGTAAEAVKTAQMDLMTKQIPGSVKNDLLNSQMLEIPIDAVSRKNGLVRAVVVKDAGDNPDIIHRARIRLVVGLTDEPGT